MAKRKIPPKDMVTSIMKEVLQRRRVISTLTELWSIVLMNLKRINRRFALSPQRIKRLAVQIPSIEVKAKTKRSTKKKITSCPVCGGELSSVYGKNLLGRRIQIGYKCKKCSYRTGMKASVPMKYIFVRKPS